MAQSSKLKRRKVLGKDTPCSSREYDMMEVLADIIEATPLGQRTERMSQLLADVEAARTAHP